MQGASFFMSRNSSNIISFDGSNRASSRASRDVVESRAARYDESASMRGRDVYASSGRVSSHAVGETSSARGLDYSQSLDSFSSDRFARGERARFSKVTRSGRIQPIVESTPYDDREASFAANSRVSSRPARSSRSASGRKASGPSGFDLGAFSAFDDLDEQLFGDGSARLNSRRSSRSGESRNSRGASRMTRTRRRMVRAFRKRSAVRSRRPRPKPRSFSIANLEATLALLRKRAVGRRSTRARWVVIISELSTTLAARARDAVPVAAEVRLPQVARRRQKPI